MIKPITRFYIDHYETTERFYGSNVKAGIEIYIDSLILYILYGGVVV
jgi:hypothetical protein